MTYRQVCVGVLQCMKKNRVAVREEEGAIEDSGLFVACRLQFLAIFQFFGCF